MTHWAQAGKLLHRSFHTIMPQLTTLQTQIGYTFQNISLLQQAVTHPSCDLPTGNNQRLEFLGDAVLDLVVAEAIYNSYTEIDEGALDRIRASIVNGKSLAAKALELDLGNYLQVSDAHRQHHPEPSHAMLEDALEAIFGAIFLDAGINAAKQFILRLFGDSIASADTSELSKNPKGRLQEWTQLKHDGAIPLYEAISEEGPDHNRRFTAAVTILGQELGRGTSSSKKGAESAAAIVALEKLKL